MAKMIPKVSPDEFAHGSERDVYVALKAQLSDDYVVLHSYPWLRPQRGAEKALAEGEADFVILHPERGLLVLEVKGGELIYQELAWHRMTSGGLKKITNPFEQGRRNMHALLDWIRERSGRRIDKDDFVHGYAVCFPHDDYKGAAPPDAGRAIILGLQDMTRLAGGIRRAFAAWTDRKRELRGYQFALLKDALLPKFRVYRPVGPQIDEAEETLIELTDDQAALFRGLYRTPRVLVEGPAGSGKTFLALDRALQFARDGFETLLICYNRALATWLNERLSTDPSCQDCRDKLDIWSFHRLARAMADRAEVQYSIPTGEDAQRFWDVEMPEILEQACEVLDSRGAPWRYDAIVVDEAQDFSELWWYVLTQSLLADEDNGPLFVFRDKAQRLRESSADPPVPLVPFDLTRNCRNTRRIAETCANIIEREIDILARAPRGAEPRVIPAPSANAQRTVAVTELTRLLTEERLQPHQVALIGPRAKDKGSLADVAKVAGVPLVSSAEAWRAGDGALVTTARAFKGLEADAVIVYDVGALGRRFTETDLYVACTRAKHVLIAIVHDDESRRLIVNAAKAPDQ